MLAHLTLEYFSVYGFLCIESGRIEKSESADRFAGVDLLSAGMKIKGKMILPHGK
jgi:hypothetical protein